MITGIFETALLTSRIKMKPVKDHIQYEDLISKIAVEFTNNPLDGKKWKTRNGINNKVEGFSGHKHQIDVLLTCGDEILLIECKFWLNRVSVSEFLVHLGRIYDIQKKHPNKKVRGALVTSNNWQAGVEKLHKAYGNKCSLFHAVTSGEVVDKLHVAFISGLSKGTSLVSGTLTGKSKI